MATCSSQLSAAQMSKVTDIVSAENCFRFCSEYLGIDRNTFKTIEYNAKFIHHDTLFQCIEIWKNKMEGEGLDSRQELIDLLTKVKEERHWFSKQDIAFLCDGEIVTISPKRMTEIQDCLKASMKRKLKKSLSHDWIPESRAHAFPLRGYYVQLNWRRKIRSAMDTENVTVTSLHELIKEKIKTSKEKQENKIGHSFIIEGGGGIGKSCSLAMLALDWAEDCMPELKQFSFVFLILLRHVNDDKSLESILIERYGIEATVAEMRSVCQGKQPGNPVLYLFDGFDEYKFGTNSDIDKILVHGKQGSFVIISSRPGDFLQSIRRQSDEEISITGFSVENVRKCTSMYLGNQRKSAEFFAQADQSNLANLLHIPIILLMACAVFRENKNLPKRMTQLFEEIIDMLISRTTLKTIGKSAKDIDNLEKLKIALGKLAWHALQRDSKQLLIFKEDVMKESADLLKLGLLFGQEDGVDTENLPEALSFQHQLIQEYFAALYIAKQIQEDESFLTSNDIFHHYEVARFTCGHLAPHDPRPITNYLAKLFADDALKELNKVGYVPPCLKEKLQSCYDESSLLEINQHFCIYPSCGHPLSDAIKFSKLVLINSTNEKDPLNLQASSVPVIVSMKNPERKAERLMKALSSAHINVIGIGNVLGDEGCKLGNFSQLKAIWYHVALSGSSLDEKHVRDLTDSINAWGSEPRLRFLCAGLPTIPDRWQATALFIPLIKALSKCNQLQTLYLFDGHPGACIPALMGAPPPALKTLWIVSFQFLLNDNVLESIAKAVRQNKLQNLSSLNLSLVGKSQAALTSLVKAFIDVRPDKELHIISDQFSPEVRSLCEPTQIILEDSLLYVVKMMAEQLGSVRKVQC